MNMHARIEAERDAELTQRIAAAAAALQDGALEASLREEQPILDLLEEAEGDVFAERYLRELHARNGIDWNEYHPDVARGAAARWMAGGRALLIKLLRPALDWLAFRQSAVNRQVSARLIDERGERRRIESELRDEIAALRTALDELKSGGAS